MGDTLGLMIEILHTYLNQLDGHRPDPPFDRRFAASQFSEALE